VRLRVQTAAAGAARVYQGTVGAIAAPYVRTDGTEKVLSKYLLSWAKKAGIKVAL
jgi:hypothetical protein